MSSGQRTWHVRDGDSVQGPLSTQQLWNALSAAVDLSVLEVKRGNTAWQPAAPVYAQLRKRAKAQHDAPRDRSSQSSDSSVVPPPVAAVRPPPPPVAPPDDLWTSAPSAITPTSDASVHDLDSPSVPGIKDWIHRFIVNGRRGLASDFGTLTATDEERAILTSAAEPIREPLAQDYAVWRKCLLWVVAAFALIGFALHLFDKLTSPSQTYKVISYFHWGLLLLQGLATVLITLSAKNWADLSESRKFARFAWISLFLGPLLMCLVPWKRMQGLPEWELTKVSILLTGIAAINIVPKLLGLMPGMIRACLTLRTLVPESSAPGWLALMVAPAYSLLFVVAAAISLQLPISSLWSIGFLFLAASPLVVIAHVGKINTPSEPEECYELIRGIRKLMYIGITIGMVALGIAILKQMSIQHIPFYNLFTALCGAMASALLLSVVAADFLIAAMFQAFLMTSRNAESPLSQDLEQKFESLSSVGLTDLGAGESELARHIGAGVRSAARRGKAWALREPTALDDAAEQDDDDQDENSKSDSRWAE